MTNFRDGELLSMVSSPDREDIEWIAISYALQWAMGEMVKHSFYIRTYSAIDELPEKILDVIAIELRVQYYEETLPIDIKRNLVRNSMRWFAKAGTVSAVQELVEVVFGNGRVIEWFEEEGMEPFTFDIEASTALTKENYEKFLMLIASVKRKSAHLRSIISVGNIDSSWKWASGSVQHAEQIFTNDVNLENSESPLNKTVYIAAVDFPEVIDKVVVANKPQELQRLYTDGFWASGFVQETVLSIESYKYADFYSELYMASGIVQDMEMEIR